jgi:hypothetical protein
MTTTRPEPILILSDAHGINLPRVFTTNVARERVENVSDEDWAILQAGPDHSEYWDAWQEVCDNAALTDDNGNKFFLCQDGDLWLIPQGMTWDEEADTWRWP